MKRLWLILFYIILLLQTSALFAQTQNGTIEFNSGYSIYGEILSIYEKPSNLGNKVEVVFRGDVSKLDKIPAIAVIKEIDEYTVVLKGESISKIFGTVGIIFNDGKYLGDEINKKIVKNALKQAPGVALEVGKELAMEAIITVAIIPIALLFFALMISLGAP
tara:strand:+ start:12 stop:497 length:486 start_codon:yes stop_codon:yes gene_type:complete